MCKDKQKNNMLQTFQEKFGAYIIRKGVIPVDWLDSPVRILRSSVFVGTE